MTKLKKRSIHLKKARLEKQRKASASVRVSSDTNASTSTAASDSVPSVSSPDPVTTTSSPVQNPPVPVASTSSTLPEPIKFVCTMCNENFEKLESLEDHLSVHNEINTEDLSRSHKKKKLYEKYINESVRNSADKAHEPHVIVSVTSLNGFVNNFACTICGARNSLYCENVATRGLANLFDVRCHCCGASTAKWWTSETSGTGNSKFFTLNRDAVYASLSCGMGADKFRNMCEKLNLSAMHPKTFQSHARELYKLNDEARKAIFSKSAEIVRSEHKLYNLENGIPSEFAEEQDDSATLDIAVSYDGTWLTRGHKSHIGFGCVIDILTGKKLFKYFTDSGYCFGQYISFSF